MGPGGGGDGGFGGKMPELTRSRLMLDTESDPVDWRVVTTNWLAFMLSMNAWRVAGSLLPLQMLVKVGVSTALETSAK